MAKQTAGPLTGRAGRVPPQDLEAEQSIICAILIDKDAVVSVAQALKPAHFYKPAHTDIYLAILELYERREPIDLLTLTAQLKKRGTFDDVGGAAYLAQLASAVPTSAHIAQYAQIVRDHSVKRRLIAASAKISESAFDERGDVRSILDETEQTVFSLSQEHLRQNFIPLKDALAESFDRLDELHRKAGGLRGISTGFWDLDGKLAGMQNSNLLILASRPGQGKTSMALNIAAHVAVKEGLPVGIFSLEMSKEELVDRLLVSESEISQNLKNLARELKIPILACSQLSRAVEQRGTKKPQLADLRESGAIEQDADVVMFIWRPDQDSLEAVKLDIQKHRNGPTGEIDLVFRPDRVKFYGVEKRRTRGAPEPQVTAEAA